MDVDNNILAIDDNRCSASRTRRDMKNGAVFGDVDPFAAEHGLDPCFEPAVLRQLKEESAVGRVPRSGSEEKSSRR